MNAPTPIARIKTIPYCTAFTPICTAIGNNNGARMISAGNPSSKDPITISSTTDPAMNAHCPPPIVSSTVTSACGNPAAVSTQAPAPPGTAAIAAPLPASAPATIEIPVLKVNAPVTPLDLNADGTVQVPPLANHNLAGWYDRSAAPGAQGTSVILGHVDDYAGPSVFYNLKNLSAGDAVDITRADGTTAVFTVDGVQKAAKASFPASDVYGTVPYPALRLVTCGGPFNAKTGQYTDSIVVYAHLTGTTTQ